MGIVGTTTNALSTATMTTMTALIPAAITQTVLMDTASIITVTHTYTMAMIAGMTTNANGITVIVSFLSSNATAMITGKMSNTALAGSS